MTRKKAPPKKGTPPRRAPAVGAGSAKKTATRRPAKPGVPRGELQKLRDRLEEAEARLAEADEALRAFRSGEVDAVVVAGPEGEQVFTLTSAERSYRILVEAMSEGAATLSADGVILYANGYLARLVGRPLERLMGSRLEALVDEDQRAVLRALMSAALIGDVRHELTLRNDSGRLVPVYLSLSAMVDATGETQLCLAAADLSAQKRSEEMVAAERLARAVLEQAGEAILVCDIDGRIIRASQGVGRLMAESTLHRRFEQVFRDPVLTALAAAALDGKGSDAVLCSLGEEADRKHLLASAAPLLGGRGDVLGAIVTLTNVSALREVQGKLEEAVRVRDEFLSIAAHELRTPLTSLQLQVQSAQRLAVKVPALAEHPLPAKLEGARRQGERLARLVDTLLDVARIKSAPLRADLSVCDLSEIVRGVVEEWSEEAKRVGSGLTLLPAPPAPGNWDRLRLEQVIANLLVNAMKYGAGKPIEVSMEVSTEEVLISVRDEGIGIAPEDQRRIFGQFERAVPARHYGGLGLGLFVSRQIAESFGGSLSVQSELGRGSRFVLRLPLH